MFERLMARVDAKARDAAEAARRGVEEAFAAFPAIVVRREGDALVFEGRGLLRRWLGDGRTRFALWAPSTSSAGPPAVGSNRLGDGLLPGARSGEDLR